MFNPLMEKLIGMDAMNHLSKNYDLWRRFACKYTRSYPDDLVNDTLLSIYNSKTGFISYNEKTDQSFMYISIRNEYNQSFNKYKKKNIVDNRFHELFTNDDEYDIDRDNQIEDMICEFNKLPYLEKTILNKMFFEGEKRSASSIIKEYNLSRMVVYKKIKSAYKKLKNE